MFSSLVFVLSTTALLVQGASIQPRAVACPNLSACNGNAPTSDSSSLGTQCSYLRYGPGDGSALVRCYYDNAGNLVPTDGSGESSDAFCPSLNTGTCPPVGSRAIIWNGVTGKCLDVFGAHYYDGASVGIYDCNGTPAQQWVWNEGSTKIQAAGTNFCLDAGTVPSSGTPMKLWTCYAGLAAQQWWRTADQRFAVQDAGQCLDLTDGKLDNFSTSQTWKCTDRNTNQVWTE